MAKVRAPTIFTTPQDAAAAFYRAFESKDIDAMMAAWAEDEEIVCVHPGGPRLVGFDAVRLGWEQIFTGETKLLFRLDEIVVLETVGMALQSAIEQVTVGDDPAPRGNAIGRAHGLASRVAGAGDDRLHPCGSAALAARATRRGAPRSGDRRGIASSGAGRPARGPA